MSDAPRDLSATQPDPEAVMDNALDLVGQYMRSPEFQRLTMATLTPPKRKWFTLDAD